MKRYSMYIDEAEEKPDGEWVKAEEAIALEASLDMADRAGLELAKQLEVANARVAELESAARRDLERFAALVGARDAANARADAAERELDHELKKGPTHAEWLACHNAKERAESEAEALRDKVERCKAVLSRRHSEPGHWENPAGDLCSADELEAALEDK